MKLQIWIWYHSWEDGTSTTLYSSEEAAKGAIQTYVHDQWNNGYMDDAEFPGDLDVAVVTYFDFHEDTEYYNIYSSDVDFPDGLFDPKLAEDEVILNAAECNLITTVLGQTVYGAQVAGLLGITRESVGDLASKVIQKLEM